MTLVYTSHFFVTPAIAALLWIRRRNQFRVYAALVLTLAVAGLMYVTIIIAAWRWIARRRSRTRTVPEPRGDDAIIEELAEDRR